jgi:hypothetical protein
MAIAMKLTKRQVVWMLLAALVLLAVGAPAFFGGNAVRVKNEPSAVVTIFQAMPEQPSGVYVRFKIVLKGYYLKAGIAKNITGYETSYSEHCRGGGVREMLLPTFGPETSGQGSYPIGNCRASGIVATPTEVELKPGERFVIAKCKDKEGNPVELFAYCEHWAGPKP